MAEVQEKAGARGRPRRLSREAIVAAAADLLEREPETTVSLNGVARALGVTPMTLYTYFSNIHDLHQALTAHMLEELVVSVDADATPAEAIAAWSHGTRAFFLRHPQLIMMLSWEGQVSIAWFDRSVMLVEALRRMGFDGSELGRVTLWAWSVIMGAINSELRDRASPHSLSAEQVASMDARLHAPVKAMLALEAAPGHYDDFFAFHIERLLDGLAALIAKR
ncbi:transcriptional regulator, TetR family [Sphingomonas laterariae]|uniref:Transcriptional regulator, TetR family n=1 Tax=Edaphosphingomonas laterariae TaxID=861865 RepID=A0A239CCI3_9SPHN|nr:TetR/AcrR family transcriptional regulator [Sphingomonas laterariae]SNS17946.1 transcriptional regulator, TetR family [Sphingomonas laterariae]